MSAQNIQTNRREKLAYMPYAEKQKFIELLKVQSSSNNEKRMVVYIVKKLEQMNLEYEIDFYGNILVQKGSCLNFPCIVSHMDTVHEIINDFLIYQMKTQNREILSAKSNKKDAGIGGDDKCGIFSCFYMLENFDNIKAVFFTQEETGCQGSSNIDFDFFNDVGYVIQLDRWGRGDFICKTYSGNTVSDDFLLESLPVMQKYGYKEAEGLITDSINLWESGLGISCINVSCGYYQHHSKKENIDLNEFWNSVLFTEELISTLGENVYESYTAYNQKYYNGYEDYEWGEWDKEIEDLDYSFIGTLCYECGVRSLHQLDGDMIEFALQEFNIYRGDCGLCKVELHDFINKIDTYDKTNIQYSELY